MDKIKLYWDSHINIKVNVNIYNCLHIKGFITWPTNENGPSALGSDSYLLWWVQCFIEVVAFALGS